MVYHDFNQFTPVVIVKLAEDIPNVLEAEWPTKEGRELPEASKGPTRAFSSPAAQAGLLLGLKR